MKRVRKSNKRAIITKAVVILSAAAIVSTGFAAWIISGNDTDAVSGNFKVEAAQDQIHTIQNVAVKTTDSNKIVYGTITGESATAASWLSNTSIGAEALTAYYTFDVVGFSSNSLDASSADGAGAVMQNAAVATDLKITKNNTDYTPAQFAALTVLPSTDPSYDATDTYGKYCVMPTDANVVYTKVTGTEQSPNPVTVAGENGLANTYTYHMEVAVTFAWGEKFGSDNPLKLAANYSNKAQVAKDLNTLYSILNGTTFTLTITSSSKA